MRTPSAVIDFGAVIEGVRADPVTRLPFYLSSNFEHLDDGRHLSQGAELIEFRAHQNARIDSILARFELARLDAPTGGIVSTVLIRAAGFGPQYRATATTVSGHIPRTQQRRDNMIELLGRLGHIQERAHGNIARVMQRGFHRRGDARFAATAMTSTDGY